MSVIYIQGGGGGATVPDATTTVIGKVRLATIAEAQGNSEAIAVTPAGVQAAIAGIVGGMTFKGSYDVALATPPLENAERGDYYVVTNVKVNPTDTNDTFDRFNQEWAVGDHLVIENDVGLTASGAVNFQGAYDVASNSPSLENASAGDYWYVSNVKVNPTDTNTTYTRFGTDWEVGDYIIINENVDPVSNPLANDKVVQVTLNDKVLKVDNSETVAQLNDLLDVTESLAAAGHVLIHDGTDYKNRALTTADIVGLAQHLYALLDVSLNELTSASYTTSTASLSVVASRDYTIDIQGYADPATTPPTPYIKDILLPASLNDDHDEIRIVNIGQGALNLQVQGSAVFYDATDPLLHNTTPVSVNAGVEVNLVGEVRTYTVPDPANPGQTIQVNKNTWYVNQSAVPSRMSLVRTGSNDWTNGFLTAADIVGVVTQGEREALQQELDRTQAGAGLNADGTLTVFAGNFINTNTTLRQAIQNLDNALKSEELARISTDTSLQNQITQEISDRAAGDAGLQSQITQEINDRSAGDNTLQAELDATQVGAGLGTGGAYTANAAKSYINTATSLMEADEKLDDAIALLSGTQVVSVNSETPDVNGNVLLDGTHIETQTSETNYTVTGASLDEHLDGIDDELGAIKTELDTTQTGAGLNADGTYTAVAGANYIASATSLKTADSALDTQIKSTQDELDVTQTGAGLDAAGTYTANATTNYIATATSLKNADELLDAQVHLLGTQIVSEVNGEAPVSGNVTIDGTHVDTLTTANNYTVTGASIDEHLDGIDTKLGDLQTELDDTQAGAGLAADGSYTANAGANYIASATSLATADNALDVAIKTEETDRLAGDAALQTELDDTQAGAGLAADGSYVVPATTHLQNATSLANADAILETQIIALQGATVQSVNSVGPTTGTTDVEINGTHVDTLTTANNYTVAGASIDEHLDGVDTKLGDLQTELDTTQTGAGLNADGTYTANGSANYIASATSLKVADNQLDTQLKSTQDDLDVVEANAVYTITSGSTTLSVTAGSNDLVMDADDLEAARVGSEYTGAATDSVTTHLSGIDNALALKAPIDAPTFTTSANAPTPTAGDNSTSIATTAFVATELASLSTTAGGAQYQLQVNDGSSGFAAAQWEVDANNHLKPLANDQYDIGSATYKVRDLYLGSNSLKLVDDAVTPNVISVSLTDAAHGHGENHVQTTDGVVAIVNADAAITDPVLAKVASTGSYSDLVDAPDSIIATSAFETAQGTYNLEAGKHYTFFPAAGATMTLVVPDSITGSGQPRGGDAIRITNWGNGQLKITTSGSSGNTWLQYSQTLSQAQTGGGAQPEFTIESRTTADLYGWSYSSGGTSYNPAWGIYFMPSMEINTKSLTTSGQMLVYDATNDELVAGGLGDLSLAFAPTNYDNTLGATVTGDKVAEHLEGIDNKFADIPLSELTDVDAGVSSATSGKALLHDGTNFKPVTLELDALSDVDTSTTAPASEDVLIFDGTNFVPKAHVLDELKDVDTTTNAPVDEDVLKFNGTNFVPVEHTVANIKDVDLATTAPTSGDFLKYDGTDWVPDTLTATVASLNDITNVSYTAGAGIDNYVLTYDHSTASWGAEAVSVPLVAPVTPTFAPSDMSYSTNSTPTGAEEIYLLDPAQAITANILAASSVGAGFRYNIKNLSTYAITITPPSGTTIDNSPDVVLSVQYSSVTLLSDGSNYFII